MNYTDYSIGGVENRAGATVGGRLVSIVIGDKGIFKVPGSWNGNRDCACALLLIPSFLQLLILDPATPKLSVRKTPFACGAVMSMESVLRFSWSLLAMEYAVLPCRHTCS